MVHLSYGKILTFFQCPEKYKWHEDNQARHPYYLSLSNAFGFCVEEYYRCMVRSRDKDCAPQKEKLIPTINASEVEALFRAMEIVQKNPITIDKIDTIGFYFSFHVPQTDVVINGKFDIIEVDKTNNAVKLIQYRINDDIRVDPIWQSIYSYALANTYPLCDAFYIEKIFLPENKTLKISYIDKTQALADIRRYITPVANAYKMQTFLAQPNSNCDKCKIGCTAKN